MTDGATGQSLSERLFIKRVEIAATLQDLAGDADGDLARLNTDVRGRLFEEVSGMSLDNFLVRAKRRSVEHFQKKDAWASFSTEDRERLVNEIASLPTALKDDDIAAKQFDYIVLSGELDLLCGLASFSVCQEKVVALAAKLETLSNVPLVRAEMALILEVQTDEYWQDIDAWALEQMRRRLRSLIKLIEADERQIVYTSFEDEIGAGTEVALPDVAVGTDKARFQMKARHFLKAHADHIAVYKLRHNEQLTAQDLAELERILIEEGGATEADLADAKSEGGLGLFVRSLVGLDRDAAKDAFAAFMAGKNLNANQIEFVTLIIDHLTEQGAMDPRRLYESPFTDFDDQGISGVFPGPKFRKSCRSWRMYAERRLLRQKGDGLESRLRITRGRLAVRHLDCPLVPPRAISARSNLNAKLE
jgi:type I restriction enzyme R subunit